MKKKNSMWVILLLGLMVIFLWLSGMYAVPGTIISIDQLYVEQVGYVGPNNEWSGSFWVIIALNDVEGSQVSLLKFNQSLVDQYGANWILDNNVEPQAEINIKMTALTPYYTLPTTRRVYQVYPEVSGTFFRETYDRYFPDDSVKIDALEASAYVFSPEDPGGWEQHTPFVIEVQKVTGENQFVWSDTVDTIGGTITTVCENPQDSSEKIMIKDLGKLGTGYTEPPYDHVVVFSSQIAFQYDSGIIRDISYDTNTATGVKVNDYSYSQYWFGGGDFYTAGYPPVYIARWHGDYPYQERADFSPTGGYDQIPMSGVDKFVNTNNWPGWEEYEAEFMNFGTKPVPGDVFQDNPDTHSAKHNDIGRGVVGFLEKCRDYQRQNLDTWGQGVEILGDGRLKVDMPYGAASSFVEIRVSTEMADAIVVLEEVTKPIITSCVWLSNSGTDARISEDDIASVVVKQDQPDVTGAVFVRAIKEPIGVPLSLDFYQQQRQMSYGEEYDFRFIATNNNPGSASVFGKLRFEALNSNGEVVSTAELTFELPPKGPMTTLTIKTLDNDTLIGIEGIPVSILYSVHSDFDYTSGTGSITFDLGSYTGNVYIQTLATDTYLSNNATTIVNPGDNYFEILVYKSAPVNGNGGPDWWWLILVSAIITTVVGVAMYAVGRRKKSVET